MKSKIISEYSFEKQYFFSNSLFFDFIKLKFSSFISFIYPFSSFLFLFIAPFLFISFLFSTFFSSFFEFKIFIRSFSLYFDSFILILLSEI